MLLPIYEKPCRMPKWWISRGFIFRLRTIQRAKASENRRSSTGWDAMLGAYYSLSLLNCFPRAGLSAAATSRTARTYSTCGIKAGALPWKICRRASISSAKRPMMRWLRPL